MGDITNIAWTEKTWNPWQGCKKVSPGCANCYMFRDKKRYGQDPETVVRSKDATFYRPIHWKEPAKVFVCSWSDFFIEDADFDREEAWSIIRNAPHLTFQILTKRPENIKGRLPKDWPLKNVWLGVTAENQDQAEKRIPVLLSIPAAVHFVSIEPMIGGVDLESLVIGEGRYFDALSCDVDPEGDYPYNGRVLGWVIVGGESGPNARPMHEGWVRILKMQCEFANVPFFMKQMSGSSIKQREAIPNNLLLRQFPKQ